MRKVVNTLFRSEKNAYRNIDVIAHRGSSGDIPAHTIPAYEEAVKVGSDWIEFDVHSSKDGQLVLTHDIDLSLTTNVSELYPERKRKINAWCIDGELEEMCDWFVEDFDLEELRSLHVSHQSMTRRYRSNESLEMWSKRGVAIDKNLFRIPTVKEAALAIQNLRRSLKGLKKTSEFAAWEYPDHISNVIESKYQECNEHTSNTSTTTFPIVVDAAETAIRGSHEVDFNSGDRMVQRNLISGYERPIRRNVHGDRVFWTFEADESPDVGLYIETKRPSHYASQNLHLEERLVEAIEQSGFDGPVIVQSFERGSLEILRSLKPEWGRVQLLIARGCSQNDRDHVNIPPPESDTESLERFLRDVASYANGVGPHKSTIVSDPSNPPLSRSEFVERAHAANLFVHPYTFRTDDLPNEYHGNAAFEFHQFFDLGVDGVFADFPAHGVFARQIYNDLQRRRRRQSQRDFFPNDEDPLWW